MNIKAKILKKKSMTNKVKIKMKKIKILMIKHRKI